MREHKYRAWHEGDMYDVEHLHFNIKGVSAIDMIHKQKMMFYHTDSLDSCILMDYTGVTDCHGRDIYESDIVRITHTALLIPANTIGVVTYVNGRYEIDTHAHTHGLNMFVDRRFRRYGKPHIEVVGNVWEHPELAPKK